MGIARAFLTVLAASVVLMTGCQDKAQDEAGLLTEENQALRAQLEERNRALEAADNERRNLAMRLADLERQARTQPAPAQPTTTGFEGIEGAEVTVGLDRVTVAVEGDVLFDSGKAVLKPQAKKALDQIARVLNTEYAGDRVAVEGYTDTDPIRRSGYKNNFELGFWRASAVRDYLISKGVSADRVPAITSFGPNMPRETKAKSRRVEVIVFTGA